MKLSFMFIVNSLLLGVGLAMDAFSVSLANGLCDPKMKKSRTWLLAGTFAFFQALMPMIGWFFVHTAVSYFEKAQKYIPLTALILLTIIGGKMIFDGLKGGDEDESAIKITPAYLLVQGIATSIDALSVGFTIADYGLGMALLCSVIISAVTLVICLSGVMIGKRFGNKMSGKATILGGIILIAIGAEIFFKG